MSHLSLRSLFGTLCRNGSTSVNGNGGDSDSLDGGLPPAVALDDRRREASPPELGHVNRHLARARRQAAVVVAGAVSLPPSGALAALGPDQLVGLRLEQAVQSVLDRLPDQLAQIGPEALLVQRYDGFGHGRPPICFLSR